MPPISPSEQTGPVAQIELAKLDGLNGFRIPGIAGDWRSGSSVSSAGDMNGDGFDDVIIGAHLADSEGQKNATVSHVVFGSGADFSPEFDLTLLDGTNGFRILGVDSDNTSGHSVSSAGDVNGDGYDDILIGAADATPNGKAYAGATYVVFGSSTGFNADFSLAALDGTNGFRIPGLNPNDQSGYSVSSAGDINGDGIGDIIIANLKGDGSTEVSNSYVVFGTRGGFEADFDLSSLDGRNGFSIPGLDAEGRTSLKVSSAGDVNNDGFDDILIGSPFFGPAERGESYIIFGSDIGFVPSFDLTSLDGANGFRIDGSQFFGGFSVSSAGDVNGDGVDDFIIGSSRTNYVVYGSTQEFGPSFDLNSLDGANGFQLIAPSYITSRVSGAGDMNGDGFDDVIVGIGGFDNYVVFGSGAGFEASLNLTSLDGHNGFRIDLNQKDMLVRPVSAAGDVNGDGFDDIIMGISSLGPEGPPAAGETYVIFGSPTGFLPPQNGAPILFANPLVADGFADGNPVALADLFTASDLNGSGDLVSFEFSDDTPGSDEGLFAKYNSLSALEFADRPTTGPYRITVPAGELDQWVYVPASPGENSIAIEAVDSVGNVSEPLIINLVFTEEWDLPTEAPVIVDPGLITVQAGATGVIYDLVATDDEDTEGVGGGLIFTSNPSPDQLELGVNLYTGEITFNRVSDGSLPEDANGDGIYELTVGVTDSDGLSDTVDLRVQVLPENKNPDAAILEYLAKEVVYGRDLVSGLFDPANTELLNRLGGLNSSDVEYRFEDESGTFLAMAIKKAGYNPILVFRGTQPNIEDWSENFRATGVGLEELNRGLDATGVAGAAAVAGPVPTLRQWLFSQNDLSIIGHSQGGAQAQLAAWIKAKEAVESESAIEIAQVMTFNSAGMTLTQPVIQSLPALFSGIPVKHSINAGDVVSLTGNSFLPGSIEYHDNTAGGNLGNAHTGYWVNDELRSLSTIRATPIVKLDGGPDWDAFTSDEYSPVAGDFGQDNEYQKFLNTLIFKVGYGIGTLVNIVADKMGVGVVRIESSSLPEPIFSLNVGDFNLRGFIVNELVPALSSRGRLAEELAGDNGYLIRDMLAAATVYLNEVKSGAQITVKGDIGGVLPVSYELHSGSTEEELHSLAQGQPSLISGRPDELFGDRTKNFQEDDVLAILGTVVTPAMFGWYLGSAVLTFDLDLDGEVDGEITLEGDYFKGAEFNLQVIGNDTHITVDLKESSEPGVGSDVAVVDPIRLIKGTSGADVLVGSDEADTVHGLEGNDTLTGKGGDDLLDGGAGIDTTPYSGSPTNYTLTLSALGVEVTDRRIDGNGTDRLLGVEFLDFEAANSVLNTNVLDLRKFGGSARLSSEKFESFIELYIAYFDRAPDAIGLNFWGTAYANGTALEKIAMLFVDQDETRTVYPDGTTDEEFTATVYDNVLGRTPDEEGFDFWVGHLKSGAVSRDQFILEVLRGVQPGTPDRGYLDVKVDIGANFAVHKGMSDTNNASAVLEIFADVGVEAAIAAINTYYSEAQDPVTGEFLMPIIGVLNDPFLA